MGTCGRIIVVVLGIGLAGCEREDALEHGAARLLTLPSESGDSTVFTGTQRLRTTMRYGQCLHDFYAANPDYAQDGPKGETIFGGAELGGEGWKDRLCELDDDAMIDCTVSSFTQELGTTSQLTVELDVSGEIQNRNVPFGPLPTEETAGCLPCADFVGMWSIDGNGNVIASAESFSPDEVCTNQGAEMAVHLAPP